MHRSNDVENVTANSPEQSYSPTCSVASLEK